MSILHSVVLGLIQGLGEFLPISSSGHLLLSRLFLGIQTDTPAMKMLDIASHRNPSSCPDRFQEGLD